MSERRTARMRSVEAVTGVRAELVERYQWLAERLPLCRGYAARVIDPLLAGEPVFLQAWKVSPLVPGLGTAGWVRVEPDDTVTRVEPVWSGRSIVGFRQATPARSVR